VEGSTEHRAGLALQHATSCRSTSAPPTATHCLALVDQPLKGWRTAHTAPARTQAGSSPLGNCQQQVRFVVPAPGR
jgi:hypothetical protein